MRICRKCNAEKPLIGFYGDARGNLMRSCKEFWKAQVKANRLSRAAQYAAYERSRANHPHRVAMRDAYAATDTGRQRGNESKRRYIEANPIKRAAHRLCGNAIRDGKLHRSPCEICGEQKAQAHHDDYSKPLDVRWLCTTHHAEWHRHNVPKCQPQDVAA